MNRIRVLVVDDAVVVRKMVTDVIASDPALEVVGTAANGRLGLAKISHLKPDLVTLDVEMPDMNGLETLAAIRKEYRKLPVIMFSTLTERGASTTMDALSLGANDYVTKPANVGSVNEALQRLRDQLIPKIKYWCLRETSASSIAVPPVREAKSENGLFRPASKVEVVAIGVSTGGPNALAALMSELPADLPVPVLIVQHMPPVFTRLLADRLGTKTGLKVCEARGGELARPGHVYIAPGDYHMTVRRDKFLVINQDATENSCRPAVDVLFRSVVDAYGAGTLAVILTGMGQDGLRGCESTRKAGGQVLAQDEASSVVWGMPGFVAKAGLANQVLPLSAIAQEIVRRVQFGRRLNKVGRHP